MKTWLICLFIFCTNQLVAEQTIDDLDSNKPSIVFVHLGKELPDHLQYTLKQARLFNECNILLIANRKPLESYGKVLNKLGVIPIPAETLEKSDEHLHFIKHSKLNKSFRDGFWYYTTERFFYLSELVKEMDMTDVFHLENDVMLYFDVETLLAQFRKIYDGIAATFDTYDRCVPGFMYIASSKSIGKLSRFIGTQALRGETDMNSINKFKEVSTSSDIDSLPIVDKTYIDRENISGPNPYLFSKYCADFNAIFDAAYIGQYLDGVDPRNGPYPRRYINPHCVIKATEMTFSWEFDDQRRKIPYVTYYGVKRKINNLHIHSKRTKNFLSK